MLLSQAGVIGSKNSDFFFSSEDNIGNTKQTLKEKKHVNTSSIASILLVISSFLSVPATASYLQSHRSLRHVDTTITLSVEEAESWKSSQTKIFREISLITET